jgi:hypothetical protein
MKTFDFKNLGVNEMTHSDLITTEGGSWLSRAWDNICYVAGEVAEAIYAAVQWISANVE